MHQFTPNKHLVTTSFWHSFPYDEFWNNSQYPNLDYVDSHCCYKQIGQTETIRIDYQGSQLHPTLFVPNDFYDTANINYKASQIYGTLGQYGVRTKPVVRGEFGFFTNDANIPDSTFYSADTQAIWLHNYIWGQINAGGAYDAGYWYPNFHIYSP